MGGQREQQEKHDGIGDYDRWLTWHHGTRLRRESTAPAPRPGIRAPWRDIDWGDQKALESTLELINPRAQEMVRSFYERIFTANPHLRGLFPADMDHQHDRLLAALLALVQPPSQELADTLGRLGRDHRKYGVREAHYEVIGDALLASARDVCGSAWTARIERAWLTRYQAAARIMVSAAEDADGTPPFWFAKVIGHERTSRDVAVLTVRPQHPYPYAAGQITTVESPRLPRVWHPYAIANAPRTDSVLEFHVRATGRGGVNDILVNDTVVGDTIRLGPPFHSQTSAPAEPPAARATTGVLRTTIEPPSTGTAADFTAAVTGHADH